jgi:uncharacterized protein YukE
MANIKLTPEELLAQSTEMSSIQTEFQTLFTQVTSCLNNLNDSWSETLSGNFTGKISLVQKSFSSVADMLENGVTAARVGANTFSEPGSVLSLICGGAGSVGNLSDLMTWMSENLGTDDTAFNSDSIIGALSSFTGMDLTTAKNVMTQLADGDYEIAIKTAADKGIDLLSGALSGDLGSDTWVGQLEELTGGTLNLSGLEKAYYKNLIGDSAENAWNIGSALANGDLGTATEQMGELAWNSTAGAVIETASDSSWNFVQKYLPEVSNFYTEKGATDSTSALGVAIGEVTEWFTGDSEAAAADANYYSEHGGIASGIVDGVVNIGSYIGEQMSSMWQSVVA